MSPENPILFSFQPTLKIIRQILRFKSPNSPLDGRIYRLSNLLRGNSQKKRECDEIAMLKCYCFCFAIRFWKNKIDSDSLGGFPYETQKEQHFAMEIRMYRWNHSFDWYESSRIFSLHFSISRKWRVFFSPLQKWDSFLKNRDPKFGNRFLWFCQESLVW